MNYLESLTNIFDEFSSINKVYLYGSRSTGTHRNNSDYDLCIILNSLSDKKDIIIRLGNFMISNNIVVHPLFLTQDEYVTKKRYSIYQDEIFSSGVILVDREKAD